MLKKHALLFLSLLLIIIPSCKEEEGGALNIAVAQEPPVLDVMVNPSLSGRNILVGNVYERLFEQNSDGEIVPSLAESYELRDEGTTLIISLKEGVVFHDGTLLEAGDVVASLNRWLSLYGNAREITKEARFCEEDGNVVINSTSSLALLPVMMATSPNPAIIFPESSLGNLSPNGLLLDAPGTGPYRISEYFSGSYILLELFDDYWREKPSIKEIRYNFVSDSVTRRLGLESGLYDFIDTVSSDDIPSLSQNENVKLYQGEETGSIVLVMNKKAGISRNQDFRKAVSLIADRDALMKACYGDYGYSLHSDYMDSPGVWSVDSSLDPYGKINKEKGREYLSSSYDGSTVRILSSNLSNLDKIAIALSSELEEEGVKTELVILDWAAFIEKRKDPEEWDIYISATSKVALPLEKNYLHSSSPGGFDDTASSALLAGLASCKTLDEAAERWEEVQIMLWNYIPVIVPGHYSTVYAASTSLQGIDFTDGYHFRFATKYY